MTPRAPAPPRRPLLPAASLLLLALLLLRPPPAGADLAPPAGAGLPSGKATAELGREVFRKAGCATCHAVVPRGGPGGGPRLFGSFGRRQKLAGGRRVRVDEGYLRESILRPSAKIVAGFGAQPMPPYAAVLSDEQVRALVLYIRSLR